MKILSEHKNFIQRISLIGIINILVGLSSIILLPILTKNYSIEEYGIWVQLTVTVTLIPNLATLGLPYGMIRFLAGTTDKAIIQEIFYSIATIILTSSFLTSLLLFIFAEYTAKFLFGNNYTIATLLPLILFFACLNYLFLNYFITFNKIKLYSLFLFIQSYLNVALTALFTYKQCNFIFIIIGFLIAQITVFLMMAFIIIKQIGFKIPSFSHVKDYLSFSIPTIPGNLAWWIVESSDRYLIGLFLGLPFVSYYNPGYSLGTMIKMISVPFSTILTPILSEYHNKNEESKIKTYLEYSMKIFLVISIPSVFGLSLLSYSLLELLTTTQIAVSGYLIVPFVALTSIFYGAYGLISQIIVVEKKTEITGVIWVLAALTNFVLNVFLIPIIGIIGAAITTMVAYGLSFFFTLHFSNKYIEFKFDLTFIIKSLIGSLTISLLIIAYSPKTILEILIIIIISIIVYLIVLLILRTFSKKEIELVKTLFKD